MTVKYDFEKYERKENEEKNLYNYLGLWECLRDLIFANSIPSMNIEIYSVSILSNFNFIAKLKIEDKFYLGNIGYDKVQLIPLD